MFFKKLSVSLIIIFSVFLYPVHALAAQVYVGGESVGIELQYQGVLITGTYDIKVLNKVYNPKSDDFQVGDLITHVNNIPIYSIMQLSSKIEDEITKGNNVNLSLKRKNKILSKKLIYQDNNGKFSTGLYVQDGLTGVGTITYYDPKTQSFGALGHIMNDSSLPHDLIFKKGILFHSYVKKIIPSQNGKPGAKIADIGSIKIGSVLDNNNYGIYGHYLNDVILEKNLIETASIDQIEKGDAYFLTVLDGHEIVKCDIKITDLKRQKAPSLKGITFEIVDKSVIEKSNGIVQGMSGSPIIQNGKLIGCVTHVDINNVRQGYGLYIDWMLENNLSS